MKQPNGWFVNDMIAFNELDNRGWISKGFEIETRDSRQAKNLQLNETHFRIATFLKMLSKETRVQFNWYVDSDYRKELLKYKEATEKYAKNEWTKFVRTERFNRLWKKMENHMLRREHLNVYLTTPIKEKLPANINDKDLESYHKKISKNYEKVFNRRHNELSNIFSDGFTSINPMKDEDHFLNYVNMLNPSFADRGIDFDPLVLFDKRHTIQQNCWFSGFKGNRGKEIGNEYSFYMDSYYHNIILLQRMPETTFPGIINRLTGLNLMNYSITANIYPIVLEEKIDETEARIKRLHGDMLAEGKVSLEPSLLKARERLFKISSGEHTPFKTDMIIRVWSHDKEILENNTSIIKSAINLMNGARYWELPNCITAKNLFYMTWPGWLYSSYTNEGYAIEEDDQKLSDMIPFSATFTGHLDDAEAIYEGELSSLVGVKGFSGNVPMNGAVFGSSRSGKSSTMVDLLSQSECFYDFTFILEEGLSYGVLTQALGEKPIVIESTCSHVINYLDTNDLPVTSDQIASATGLLLKMRDENENSSGLSLSQKRAIFAEHINMLYEDTFDEWKRKHENLIPEIARVVLSVDKYRKEEMAEGVSYLEAWTEFRDHKKQKIESAMKIYTDISEDEITRVLVGEPDLIRNSAFAWFERTEFPTHSQLHELLLSTGMNGAENKDILKLAYDIGNWCGGGSNGSLFDGHTNVPFNKRWLHFELSKILANSKLLKEMVIYLLGNQIRALIMSMPRGWHKRRIYEEASKVLVVEGGEEIISEDYAQLSKYSAQIITIVQQYNMFKNSPLRPIIIGNSAQYFIFKQKDQADISDLAGEKGIYFSERGEKVVSGYVPAVDQKMPIAERYASFTYHLDDAPFPSYGTARNICCPEMLYVSSSDPVLFDKRSKQLKKEPDIVAAIKKYSRNTEFV